MAVTLFGHWLPDRPALDNPGLLDAKNVKPITGGYGPWPSLVDFSNALDGRALGGASGVQNDGTVFTFAGDDSKLYRLSQATFSDVSKVGGYTLGARDRWRFCAFGDLMVVTSFSDPVQAWALGTSAAFADLGATVPQARYCAVVKDFLVLGHLSESGTVTRNKVAWSPIGDPGDDDWGNVTKQSDFQEIFDADEVTGLAGGEFGLVFCRNLISRMTYVGPDAIFQFDTIDRNRGCIAPGSLVQWGNLTFFLDQSGFHVHNGQEAVPIGTDRSGSKMDQWFFDHVSEGDMDKITAAVDPIQKLYMAAFPSSGGGYPDTMLLYHWATGAWAYVEQDLDVLTSLISPGYTLEDLDTLFPGGLETVSASLDDPEWAGGESLILGAFDSSKKLRSFGGSALTGMLETGDRYPFAPNLTWVKSIRPMVEGSCDIAVSIGGRECLTDTIIWNGPVSPNSRSKAAGFRTQARYTRARFNLTGDDWTRAVGYEPDAVPTGGL